MWGVSLQFKHVFENWHFSPDFWAATTTGESSKSQLAVFWNVEKLSIKSCSKASWKCKLHDFLEELLANITYLLPPALHFVTFYNFLSCTNWAVFEETRERKRHESRERAELRRSCELFLAPNGWALSVFCSSRFLSMIIHYRAFARALHKLPAHMYNTRGPCHLLWKWQKMLDFSLLAFRDGN